MTRLLHTLTHRHVHYARDGHGLVVACSWRRPWAPVTLFWQPDDPEWTRWIEIPAGRLLAWLDATDQAGRFAALRGEPCP